MFNRMLGGVFAASSRFLCCAALAIFLGAAGCNSKGGGSGNEVSGKVTVGGQAVSGTVTFLAPDGKLVTVPIKPDGTYSTTELTANDYKVGVQGLGGVGPPKGKGGEMPGMPSSGGVAPPAKYSDPATSGLTFKNPGGKQTHNIDLTP